MNKLFLILIAFMWTLPKAVVFCDDLDPYIENGYNKNEVISAIAVDRKSHYESECLAEGDAGSHFTYSWEFVSTCSGMSGSRNGYVKSTATCNICTGQWAHDELEENENACREDCRTSNYVCRPPSFPEQWGGDIVKKNSNGGACGDLLPNCSESSSSESVESSSSEEPESSSSEDDDSSSSFEESSSSKKASSSSMNGRYDLIYGYEGLCNGKGQFSNAFCSIDCGTGAHYMRKPGFVGSKKLYFWCSDYGDMEIRTNIPEIYPNVYLHIECYNSEAEEWRNLNVPELPLTYLCYDTKLSTIEGCPTTESVWSTYPYHGWAANLYAKFENAYYASSVSDLMSDYYWVDNSSGDDEFPSNYSRMDLLNEPEFVSFFNECKRRVKTRLDIYSMAKEEFGDFVWHGENSFNLYSPYVFLARQGSFDFSDEYYQSRGISSYEDYCQFLRGENAELYQSDSLIYEVYYDEESSHISKTYDIIYYCAPPKSSSSSAEVSSSSESSSSSEFSSSSEKSSSSEESSSSEPPSSSSLSSSSEESSSSSEEIVVESSSVMPVDEPFVAGADQVYTPDQIFSSGLQNMEPGVCYSLNPDRGTIYGWNISYNASDSWWWRKVDCETGKKPVEKGIGFCAAFPGSKPDKVSACYAHNGSCYVCDNSKDYIDCNADWLWNYNFPTHSWFKQVDCYDPFGEDDFDGQCPDGVLLKRNVASEEDEMPNYEIDFSLSSKVFDVMGRRLNDNRSKFLKTFKRQEKKIQPIQNTVFDEGRFIYIPIEDLGLSRNYLAKDGVACRAKSCGNLGKDYGVNGDVGVYCGYPCTELIEENGYLRIEITKKKQTGSCSEGNPKYTITFKLSAKTTIKRKNVYYVAPIGYKMGSSIVTEDAYKAGKRHEIGHKDSFNCLEKHKMFKSEYIFELEDVCEDEFKCNKKGVIKGLADKISETITVQRNTGIDKIVQYNKKLWQRMCGWYHDKFSRYDGPGGPNNPKDIVCPTTATLLDTNYVLTGCEVFE